MRTCAQFIREEYAAAEGRPLPVLAVETITGPNERTYTIHIERGPEDKGAAWRVYRHEFSGQLGALDRDRVPACVAVRAHQLWRECYATVAQ